MPASARVLLLLAPALLVQQAHCSEVSEPCTEEPMTLKGLEANPHQYFVLVEPEPGISCALVDDSGELIANPNPRMPAVIS